MSALERDPRPAIEDAYAAVQIALELIQPRDGIWPLPTVEPHLHRAETALAAARRDVAFSLAARAALEAA